MAGWQRRWEAATALATLAAVVVALVPIWQGEGRKRQQARVLRVRLMESLMPIVFFLEGLQSLGRPEVLAGVVRFDDRLREQMRLFRSLLPEATHLDADEFDRLLAVYDALAVPLVTGGVPGDRVPVLLQRIHAATALLGPRAGLPRDAVAA